MKFLDISLGVSFLHVSANLGRSILEKVLENTPLPKEVVEKLLEVESQIAEPFPNPEPPEKEETPILDFMLEFKDEIFDEYENTLN